MKNQMQRVTIIGCSGSGKSTLALQLAALTKLPVTHLAREYWRAGWIAPPEDVWCARLAELTTQARWIMDGNYTGTLPLRLAVADTVIFLDFPRWQCLANILWRSVTWFGRTRPDMAEGCREQFSPAFLLYVWRWRRNSRPRALAALANFHGNQLILKSRREVSQFLLECKCQLPAPTETASKR
jgi:adenylate kinase family enzyme